MRFARHTLWVVYNVLSAIYKDYIPDLSQQKELDKLKIGRFASSGNESGIRFGT